MHPDGTQRAGETPKSAFGDVALPLVRRFFPEIENIFIPPIHLKTTSPTWEFVIDITSSPPKVPGQSGDVSDEHAVPLTRLLDCLPQSLIGLSVRCREQRLRLHTENRGPNRHHRDRRWSRRACLPAGTTAHAARTQESRTTRQSTTGLYTTGRTPCGDKPERTTPSCSPFGARMQWPEPAHTEQSLARQSRPTKGGAVRIRIALSTALAVLCCSSFTFRVIQQ